MHSKCTDMSLSIPEAQGKIGELVLHWTAGHEPVPCEWCGDIPAAGIGSFAKGSRLIEVSASVGHGDSFQSF